MKMMLVAALAALLAAGGGVADASTSFALTLTKCRGLKTGDGDIAAGKAVVECEGLPPQAIGGEKTATFEWKTEPSTMIKCDLRDTSKPHTLISWSLVRVSSVRDDATTKMQFSGGYEEADIYGHCDMRAKRGGIVQVRDRGNAIYATLVSVTGLDASKTYYVRGSYNGVITSFHKVTKGLKLNLGPSTTKAAFLPSLYDTKNVKELSLGTAVVLRPRPLHLNRIVTTHLTNPGKGRIGVAMEWKFTIAKNDEIAKNPKLYDLLHDNHLSKIGKSALA